MIDSSGVSQDANMAPTRQPMGPRSARRILQRSGGVVSQPNEAVWSSQLSQYKHWKAPSL